MTTCARCGADQRDAVGRFCTNCGAPRHAAASPTTAAVPPPVHMAPPPQRFPLYADESASTTAPTSPAQAAATVGAAGRHRRRGWRPWPALGLAAVLVIVVAIVLLGPDDEPGSDRASDASATGAPSPSGTAPTFEGEPTALAGLAVAEAPAHDVESVDISTGQPTTYVPANMVDADPGTAWRVEGNAAGTSLTFTFPEPVTLTGLGLVNGYAKTSVDGAGTAFDLYAGGRRVLAVEWVLDGGDPLPQSLLDGTREAQLLDVGAVEATVVELRLVSVSEPGEGPAARDTTAISEVVLDGYAD